MCVPIESRNATTNNILVKVTVPRRTGRKRKRGTQEPFQDDIDAGNMNGSARQEPRSQRIHPSQLLRILEENSEKYSIEVIGKIQHTQRFRGNFDLMLGNSYADSSLRPCRLPTVYQPYKLPSSVQRDCTNWPW
jgi:general transcription factor 3C polypeptide 5 (transcription factor C subunit 1)